MDSRIVPLEMVGLTFGDAKIIRPLAVVTTSASGRPALQVSTCSRSTASW